MTPDVIVPSTNRVTRIVQQETRTIPVVFAFVGDPVGSGFVTSLARPGKNLTGFANFENSIGGKWLELFKEIAPRTGRAGFIFHAAEAAAAPLAIKLTGLPVRDAIDIEEGITAFAAVPDCGLKVRCQLDDELSIFQRHGMRRDIRLLFSRARNLRTYRSSSRLNSRWSSTSRPRKHSASTCRRRYSPAPTK